MKFQYHALNERTHSIVHNDIQFYINFVYMYVRLYVCVCVRVRACVRMYVWHARLRACV